MIPLAYLWGSCRRAGAGTSPDEFVFQQITESQLSGQHAEDYPACARELPDGDTAGYLHGHPRCRATASWRPAAGCGGPSGIRQRYLLANAPPGHELADSLIPP
jgi:hypothetical protein